MARLFDSSGDLIGHSLVASPGAAGSIFLRFRPLFNPGDSAEHWFFDYEKSGNSFLDYLHFTDNNMYIGFEGTEGGAQRLVVADTGLFSSGVWANHLYTWETNSQFYYIDNVQKQTNSTLTPTTGFDGGLYVGNIGPILDGAGANPANLNGDLAEFAMWNRVLNATERSLLQSTGYPGNVPYGLVQHFRLLGVQNPEPDRQGGQGLTVTGAVEASHPLTEILGVNLKMSVIGG